MYFYYKLNILLKHDEFVCFIVLFGTKMNFRGINITYGPPH